jgi:mRNA-degrading endonuclease RelE of RelBE toxin-antitoxin system
MPFQVRYTPEAEQQYKKLSESKSFEKQFKAVRKALSLLSNNPRHPWFEHT